MTHEFRAQMALECLRFASNQDHPTEDVISRATAYLSFVLNEQSTREQIIAAMEKSGIK